jgi:phosphoribosylanthranilate isomerase
MPRVKAKICGIGSLEEAHVAVEFGADALGFNFWSGSPRYISRDAAKKIIRVLPPFVTCVGVFVNEESRVIDDVVSEAGLGAIQLHGDEPPEFCAGFPNVKTIKAVSVGPDFEPESVAAWPVSAVLLDARVQGSYGGTGCSFDWRAAVQAKRFARIILAGGLTIENVKEAMTTVMPMAIDICSGVELHPGRKDLERLRRFLSEVARINATLEGV